jgi:hypothetical protein
MAAITTGLDFLLGDDHEGTMNAENEDGWNNFWLRTLEFLESDENFFGVDSGSAATRSSDTSDSCDGYPEHHENCQQTSSIQVSHVQYSTVELSSTPRPHKKVRAQYFGQLD